MLLTSVNTIEVDVLLETVYLLEANKETRSSTCLTGTTHDMAVHTSMSLQTNDFKAMTSNLAIVRDRETASASNKTWGVSGQK